MGKGSPIICARVPQELLDQMAIAILRRNTWTRGEPWTQASFIVTAIRNQIAKMARSRKPKTRRQRHSVEVVEV